MTKPQPAAARNLLDQLKLNVLRPDFPIPDLLRACIMLGSELGSASLRSWATAELRGYQGEPVPPYRVITAHLKMDYIYGLNQISGQDVQRGNFPDWFLDADTDFSMNTLPMPHSIDGLVELMENCTSGSIRLAGPQTSMLAQLITGHHQEPYFQVTSVYFVTGRAELASILGAVRTQLTELLADLGDPLSELPTGTDADRMVEKSVNYNQYIQGNNGAVSQGENASAVMSGGGVSVPELINLISAVRSAVEDQPDLADSEIVGVVDTLSDELGLDEPDTAVVEDGRRRLATFLSETVARPGVTTAVSALVTALGQWVGLG